MHQFSLIPYTSQVTHECSGHIKRVMHQRATNIRLMPEIEQPCMTDLGQHCLDKANGEGEVSMLCTTSTLLKILSLSVVQVSKKCSSQVRNMMHERAEMINLMPQVQIPCLADIGKLCHDKSEKNEVFQFLNNSLHPQHPPHLNWIPRAVLQPRLTSSSPFVPCKMFRSIAC